MATVYGIFTAQYHNLHVEVERDDCGGETSFRIEDDLDGREITDPAIERLFRTLIQQEIVALKSRGTWSNGGGWGDRLDKSYHDERTARFARRPNTLPDGWTEEMIAEELKKYK